MQKLVPEIFCFNQIKAMNGAMLSEGLALSPNSNPKLECWHMPLPLTLILTISCDIHQTIPALGNLVLYDAAPSVLQFRHAGDKQSPRRSKRGKRPIQKKQFEMRHQTTALLAIVITKSRYHSDFNQSRTSALVAWPISTRFNVSKICHFREITLRNQTT